MSLARRLAVCALLGAVPTLGRAQAPGVPARDAAPSADSARVAVAARPIARATVLTAEDVAVVLVRDLPPRQQALARRAETVGTADAVVGFTARRAIAAGEPLVSPAVAPTMLVKAGDVVQVVLRRDGLQLTLAGRAAGHAALGQRIAVQLDAARRVEGVVAGPALVRLD